MNRRYFIGSALAATASGRAVAAGDKLNVAIIGLRGRGKALANEFAILPDANVACLVDVDQSVLAQVADNFATKHGKKPQLLGDFRRVLDDKNIDAVAVATPDHWHAPIAIMACEAGKDVYIEKPCSHNVREGKLLVETARRTNRIVQHGTQARSRPSTCRAIEMAHTGKIGKVLMAKAWNVQKRKDLGHKPDSPPPPGVDYDMWVGPARWMPFNENRFHYNWHWHWNFGTGDIGNDGAHQLDQARWALGVDYPLEVTGMGRKLFFQDDQITPDTMNVTFNYPDKVLMFEMRIWNPYAMDGCENGVAIYGSDGMIQIGKFGDGISYRVFDAKGKVVRTSKDDPEQGGGDLHVKNFVECVRSRKAPNAEIGIGFLSALHCHLGNIVARVGRPIRFDPRTGTITGDSEANRLLTREYRDHWAKPKGV